ncbi:MAG TPA: apolipoprotein N-acyltransferase [Mycobacteriales bacterium]|nr:apolipoprotein N-acyltransferase [Mycobacteriales bacterium]
MSRVARSEPVFDRYAFLAAAASGGLLVFAFPPFGFWPAAPVAVAMLSLIVHGRSAKSGSWYGWIFGLAFCLPLLHWAGTYVGLVPWLLLGLLESAFFCLLGAGLAIVQRLPFWPAWAAAMWVAEEAFRDRFPFGGLPWGRLAFSQPQGLFLPYAAIGGAPLLTFVVALTGCLAARAFEASLSRGQLKLIALAAAGVLEVPLIGVALSLTVHSGDQAPHENIAVIQGNVPRLGLDFDSQREAVLHNHVNETLKLARQIRAGQAPKPKIVVWPENASDIDPLDDPAAKALITHAAQAVGAPILVGAILDGPGNHVRNAGIVWDPRTGPGEMYLKRHPVPFGEYIPLRSLARKVTNKVDLVPRDMVAGDKVGALQIGGLTVGDVICFEVAYDGLVRSDVTHGAKILLTQTNNATFGRTGESPQQVAIARVRAVEHNRANLVASTSGISAVIAPNGKVLKKTGIFTSAILDGPVPIQSGTTLATRLGALPEWLLTAVGVGALLTVAGLRVWEALPERMKKGADGAEDREKERV